MAELVGGDSPEPADGWQRHPPGKRWSVHPWRLAPPLIVLITVAVIWATRYSTMLANHWAYPLTVTVIGAFALLMVVRALPRRLPPALPYPGAEPVTSA